MMIYISVADVGRSFTIWMIMCLISVVDALKNLMIQWLSSIYRTLILKNTYVYRIQVTPVMLLGLLNWILFFKILSTNYCVTVQNCFVI